MRENTVVCIVKNVIYMRKMKKQRKHMRKRGGLTQNTKVEVAHILLLDFCPVG